MIEIWGKPNCPFCVSAVNLASEKQLKFRYITLGTHFTREEVLEEFPGAKTFPQIKIDGVRIGGFTEMKAYLQGEGQ